MKKICFITTVSLTMEAFVVESAKHLHQEGGYDITLICNHDENFAKSLPDYITFIPIKMARGIDPSAIASIWQIFKVFKREKFDLVQYSTPNASLYASIAAALANVKLRIYNQCGLRYVSFNGFKRKLLKFFEKLSCSLSTHVRSQSPKNMAFAISEKLCKAKKISVVGIGGTIGVDLKECNNFDHKQSRLSLRQKYGIPQNAFVYGYVGRINTDKGINELLTAFKDIYPNNPDAFLVLVGMLDPANPIEPQNLIFAQNCPNVVLTDAVPLDEVYAHMTIFDVLVHPTYREGFGKVLQEALGVGIPIITTDVPGPSEVIENNISGILCEVKNPKDLYDKMQLLYKNEALLKDFSSNGLLRAQKYFDRPIMLNNILQAIKSTMEG